MERVHIQKERPGANPSEKHSHCGLAYHSGHVDGLRGALELPGHLHVHLLGVDMLNRLKVRLACCRVVVRRRDRHGRSILDDRLSSTDLFATVPGTLYRVPLPDIVMANNFIFTVVPRWSRFIGNGRDADTVQGIDDLLCHLDGAVSATDTEQCLAVARLHVEYRHVQKTENHRGDKHLRDTETFPALY